MRIPLVLAANLETLIGVAFVVISLISGLMNYLNSRAKPNGPNMGRVTARRGHQVLLPKGSAYQLTSAKPSVAIVQTMDGPVTVKRWSEICTLGDA